MEPGPSRLAAALNTMGGNSIHDAPPIDDIDMHDPFNMDFMDEANQLESTYVPRSRP